MIKACALGLLLATGMVTARLDPTVCGSDSEQAYLPIKHACQAILKPALLPLHLAFAGQGEKREPRVTVYNVANTTQLNTALTKVVGGDVISLASGNYGAVSLYQLKPNALVTIVSANAAAPAHFDSLNVNSVQNFAFRNVDIGHTLTATEAEYTPMAAVRDSTRVIFDHVSIHGSLDGNYANDGYGLFASNTTGLVVTGSSFTEETKGIVVQQMTNLQLDNNSFHDMRSDAINVAASNNVLVDSNFFQGFHPIDGDHADAIQFYNLGQPHGSSDIVIRNNVLMPGGVGPQGVWISDGDTYGYTNVTIQNNLLWSDGLYNGIGVFNATGLNITGNTAVSPTNDDKRFWIRVGESSDVHINSNIADDLIIGTGVTGLQQSGNTIFATDPGARALLHNLNTPTSANDLITPGKGYHPIATPDKAPMSDAIGGAISSLLSKTVGASVSAVPVGDPASSHPSLPATASTQQVYAVPLPFNNSAGVHDFEHIHVGLRGPTHFEHFAALP